MKLCLGAALCAAALVACTTQASTAPAGWQPRPGASAAWTSGAQQYSYAQRAYPGTLQDLASAEAVNVVMQHHGAKFQGSDIFQSCPGRAAVATFTLPGGQILQEAFAVQNDQAIVATYIRPQGTAVDPAVSTAMNGVLCTSVL
jgi:hypothetical protein